MFKTSVFRVRNRCAAYGAVVAKFDLVAAQDRMLHLNNRNPIRGSVWRRIRSISCCSDMGICNRSDAVTDEGCLARFRRVSPAALRCKNPTASAAISGENYSCIVTAQCRSYSSPLVQYTSSRITLPFVALGDVHDCGGLLQRWPCGEDPPDTATLSARDAHTVEAPGAVLHFRVVLNRALPGPVRIDYATSGVTARAGSDFRRASGTLTFAAGETARTVSVPVLDDSHDEKPETLALWLSNPRPSSRVRLRREYATGTIFNTDPMPRAWIGRFGRAVTDQVLDAVGHRMRAKPASGVEARLAGQKIGADAAFAAGPHEDPLPGEAGAPGFGQPMGGRELLSGSSFSLTAKTDGGGFVSVWGVGAATQFAGRDAADPAGGGVAVDGEVTSGLLGADLTRGRWTAGLVVSHSRGDGGYRGAGAGTVSATLTGVWPWVEHSLDERLSVWGVAGYSDGSLTLEPRAEDGTRAGAIRTDFDLLMAAIGLRGVALDGGGDGVSLAVKTGAMTVRTASDAVSGAGGNLAAAVTGVARLRLGLEGSRPFPLGDGSVLTPSMEIGLRHDGGDAETGFGAYIGAGVAWQDAERGLGAELRGRALLAHEAEDFQERGLSGSVAWDPVTGDRGPRLSLTQVSGVPALGSTDALLARRTPAGPATGEPGDSLRNRWLEARFGYGFPAFGHRFTATPEIAVRLSDAGRDYSLGYRLTPGGVALELALEVRWLESASRRNAPSEHTATFRVTSRF